MNVRFLPDPLIHALCRNLVNLILADDIYGYNPIFFKAEEERGTGRFLPEGFSNFGTFTPNFFNFPHIIIDVF